MIIKKRKTFVLEPSDVLTLWLISVGFYVFHHFSTFSMGILGFVAIPAFWQKGARSKATQQQEWALACSFHPAGVSHQEASFWQLVPEILMLKQNHVYYTYRYDITTYCIMYNQYTWIYLIYNSNIVFPVLSHSNLLESPSLTSPTKSIVQSSLRSGNQKWQRKIHYS